MVAAELIRPINTNVYIVAFIMEAAGLSPLLMATLGFLRTVYVPIGTHDLPSAS